MAILRVADTLKEYCLRVRVSVSVWVRVDTNPNPNPNPNPKTAFFEKKKIGPDPAPRVLLTPNGWSNAFHFI